MIVPFDMALDREYWQFLPDGASVHVTRLPDHRPAVRRRACVAWRSRSGDARGGPDAGQDRAGGDRLRLHVGFVRRRPRLRAEHPRAHGDVRRAGRGHADDRASSTRSRPRCPAGRHRARPTGRPVARTLADYLDGSRGSSRSRSRTSRSTTRRRSSPRPTRRLRARPTGDAPGRRRHLPVLHEPADVTRSSAKSSRPRRPRPVGERDA